MLEHLTESLFRELSQRTIGDSSSISLKTVLDAAIPKGIKTYFQAEALSWFEHDLSSSRRFTRIDKTAPEMQHLATSFLVPLTAAYVFTREEFLETLENAILFLENYLCRPQWTLHNFVFEEPSPVTRDVLLAKLRYFTDYAYLPRLIEQIVRRRNLTEIEPGAFQELLARIDEEVVRQHTARELGMLLKPIFEFLNFANSSPDQAIPVKTVLLFFEDKKMPFHREYIDSICHIRNQTTITHESLLGMVDDFSTVLPTPQPTTTHTSREPDLFSQASPIPSTLEEAPETHILTEPEVDEPQAQEPESSEGSHEDQVTEDISPNGSVQESIEPVHHGTESLVEELPSFENVPPPQEADSSNMKEDVPEEVEEPSEQEKPEPATYSGEPPKNPNIPLSLTSAGLQESVPAPRLPNLNLLIPEEEQNRFIRRIFRKDTVRFAAAIAALNATATWKEASLYLNRLFQENNLDPFSPEVVRFTDAIQLRFAENKKATE